MAPIANLVYGSPRAKSKDVGWTRTFTVREVTVHAAEYVCGVALVSGVKHANDIISIAPDY